MYTHRRSKLLSFSLGGGRLEVRRHGHRQDLPVGFCDSVCAGNTGTLPPAAHQLLKMRRLSSSRPFCFSLFDYFCLSVPHLNYCGNYPSCSCFTSNAGLSSILLFWLFVSSFCLMLFSGTPSSSAITSGSQLSLSSHDVP